MLSRRRNRGNNAAPEVVDCDPDAEEVPTSEQEELPNNSCASVGEEGERSLVESGHEPATDDDDHDDEEDEGNEEEEEEMDQEIPEAGQSTAVRFKKRTGKKKRAQPVVKRNKFKTDDDADVAGIVKVTKEALKCLQDCAKTHLPGLFKAVVTEKSSERKKEKKSALKLYHKVAVEAVEARLKSLPLADIVQQVFEDIDLETLANEEKDDEQFFKLMEEFQEACMKKIEEESSKVTMDVVDQDGEYQECLEMLNDYVDRSKSSTTTMSSSQLVDVEEVQPGPSSQGMRHSEGLEALTEYIPIHDPLTKQLLKDPYVNRVCKHVYEFNTAIQLIQMGKFKCPYPACTNKKVVKLSDLVKDEVIARKIKEQIRTAEYVD